MSVQLPLHMPIMTLPQVTLFPQALLPLYIFEPRYRAMLKSSLENQRVFAISMATSESKPRRVGGVGLIRACVDMPDGSSNLLLQGITRVRFTNFVQEQPYYVGEIEVLSPQDSDTVEVDALARKVVEMIQEMQTQGRIDAEEIVKFITNLNNPDALSDIVTANFIESPMHKQEILEAVSLRQRLHKIILILREQNDSSDFFKL